MANLHIALGWRTILHDRELPGLIGIKQHDLLGDRNQK